MTYIEVDQSGKIEDLRQDTIVAFSNGNCRSIRLSRKIKREIFFQYRTQIRHIVQKMFAICLFHLLDGHIENQHSVIVCPEYPGWEEFIKKELCRLLRDKMFDHDVLQFGNIGKQSRAHKVALMTNRQILESSRELKREDILKYIK